MAVQLLALTFNHNASSTRNSALNLTLNSRQAVEIPEWVAQRVRQYPAAYGIEDTLGANIIIEGQLTGPPNTVVHVMGVPVAASGTHLLGPILPTPVAFGTNRLSGPVRFRLISSSISHAGIGVHDVQWRWMHRGSLFSPWNAFAETSHRIFTVLRAPKDPWFQQPFPHPMLPWAVVLEWACRWAAGTFAAPAAATAITLALFAQGGERLRYSCAFGAPTNYSYPEFDCTAFLERLGGGVGRGPNLNCTDCATVVSTFANAVGCDLSQARMFNPVSPFAVNAVQLIGHLLFAPVCGPGFFDYHEVAWEGFCTELDKVYDACLAVLAPPTLLFPATPLVPTHMLFGFPNQGSYRDLLAAPGSRLICQPQPTSRIRRSIY